MADIDFDLNESASNDSSMQRLVSMAKEVIETEQLVEDLRQQPLPHRRLDEHVTRGRTNGVPIRPCVVLPAQVRGHQRRVAQIMGHHN